MKKLLIIFILMGLVSAVNAQSIAVEKDIFTEQVINSISSLKSGSERFLDNKTSVEGNLEIENAVSNPFQYVLQPIHYISMASISFESMTNDFGIQLEGLGGVDTRMDIGAIGEEEQECLNSDKVNS